MELVFIIEVDGVLFKDNRGMLGVEIDFLAVGGELSVPVSFWEGVACF